MIDDNTLSTWHVLEVVTGVTASMCVIKLSRLLNSFFCEGLGTFRSIPNEFNLSKYS